MAVNISDRPISYGRKKGLPLPSKSPFPIVTVIDYKTYPVEKKKVTVFFMKVMPKTTGTSAPVKVIAKTLSCFWKLKEEIDNQSNIDRLPLLPPLTIYLNSDPKNVYNFLKLALTEWFQEISTRPTITDLDCIRKFISTDRVMVEERDDDNDGDDEHAISYKVIEEFVWPLVRTWAPARYDMLEAPPQESEICRSFTADLLDDDLMTTTTSNSSSSLYSETKKKSGGNGSEGVQDDLFKESVASMLAFGSESEDGDEFSSKLPSSKFSVNKPTTTSKLPPTAAAPPQQQQQQSGGSGGAPILKSKTTDGLLYVNLSERDFGSTQRRNRAASFINAQAMAAAYSASAAAGKERMETFQGGIARTATRSFGDAETGASLFENNSPVVERPKRSYSNLLFNINNIMNTDEDDLEALESSRSALAQLSHKSLEIYINRQKKKQEEYEIKMKQRSGSSGSMGHPVDDMSSKSTSSHPHPHSHGGSGHHRHSMPANKFSPKILKDLESVLFECNRKEESKKRQFGAGWEVVGSIPPPDCHDQDDSVFACLLLDDIPLTDSDIQKLKQDLITASTVANTTASNKPMKANQAVTMKYERMKVMLKSLSKFRLSCLQMLQIFSILETHNVGADEWTYLALISIVKLTDTSLLVEGYPKLWPKDLHPPNLHVEFEKRCHLALQVIHYEIKVESTSREIHAICANSVCELRRARQLIKNAAILNVGIPLGARIKALEEHTTEPMKLLIKQSQIRIDEASAKIKSAQSYSESANQFYSQLVAMGTDLSGLFMRGSTAQCSTSESEDLVLQALNNLLQQCDLAQTKAKSYFIEASLLQSTIKKCSTEIEAVQSQLNHHKASLSDRMKKKWGQAKTGSVTTSTTSNSNNNSSSQGTGGASEGSSSNAGPVKKSIQGGSLAGAGLKKLNSPANATSGTAAAGGGSSTPKSSSLAGSSVGQRKLKLDSQLGTESSSNTTNSPKGSGSAAASANSSPFLGVSPHSTKLGGSGFGGAAPSPSNRSSKSTAASGTNWKDESKEDNPLVTFAELISIKNNNNPSGKSTQSQKGKKRSTQTPGNNSESNNTLLYLLMAKLPLVRDLRKLLKEEEEEVKKRDKKTSRGISKLASKSPLRPITQIEDDDENELEEGDMKSNTSIIGDDSDVSSNDGAIPENPRFKELKVGKHSLQWARRRKSIRIELPTYCIGTRGGLGRKDFVLSAEELDENLSISDAASLVDDVDC